jgi:hypothetical protein
MSVSTVIQNSTSIPCQEKEIKGIQIGKEEDKLIPFCRSFTQQTLKSPPNTLRSNENFQQINRIQNQLTKIVAFLYTNNEHTEKVRKQSY